MGHRHNFGSVGQRTNGNHIPSGAIDLAPMMQSQAQQQQHVHNVVVGFAEKIYIDLVGKHLPILSEGDQPDQVLLRKIAKTSLEYAPYFAEAVGMLKVEDNKTTATPATSAVEKTEIPESTPGSGIIIEGN